MNPVASALGSVWLLVVILNAPRAGAAPPAALGRTLEQNIGDSRVLPVPLEAVGGAATLAETEELSGALAAYGARAPSDDASALEGFVKHFPDSRWAPAVWVNLGVIYRNTGYPSRAIEALQAAWNLSKADRGAAAVAVADRAAVELAELLAGFGRSEELRALLGELQQRRLRGSARQRILSITRGLDVMDTTPQTSFVCGPLSLLRILNMGKPEPRQRQVLLDVKSRREGVALTELRAAAVEAGLSMRMAFRPPGDSEMPTPAVMNLKVRHFVALQKKDGDCYLTYDPSFEHERCISVRAVNAEGSGYFLIPDGPLPPGWHDVYEMEGWGVWGR